MDSKVIQLSEWSPEVAAGKWLDESPNSLRDIQHSTGISRSKLALFKKGKGNLTVRDAVELARATGNDTRDILPAAIRLGGERGAHTKLANMIGDAMVERIEHRTSQNHRKISIEDVCFWHEVTEGRLHLASQVRDHLIAWRKDENARCGIRPVEVGQNSLAAKKIIRFPGDLVLPENVEEFLEDIGADKQSQLLQGYAETYKNSGRSYLDRKLIFFSGDGVPTCVIYLTVLLAGQWTDDKPVIWNFSTELSSRVATEAELEDLRAMQGFH